MLFFVKIEINDKHRIAIICTSIYIYKYFTRHHRNAANAANKLWYMLLCLADHWAHARASNKATTTTPKTPATAKTVSLTLQQRRRRRQ